HIQSLEGFGKGGSPEQFLPEGFGAEYKATGTALREAEQNLRGLGVNVTAAAGALRKQAEGKELYPFEHKAIDKLAANPEATAAWTKAHNEHSANQTIQNTAIDKYRMLSGEVEARNVQERHAQGDWESFPHSTQGYPQGTQILNYDMPGHKLIPVEHDPF